MTSLKDDKWRNASGNLTPPMGYVQVALENGVRTFNTPTNVAFGANGSFLYKTGIIGSFTFDRTSFGGDPARNYVKGGFAEVTESNKADATSMALEAQSNTPAIDVQAAVNKALADAQANQAANPKNNTLLYIGIGVGVIIVSIVLYKVLSRKG